MTAVQLLALHAQVADELVVRGITRSYNNPTGDLAERLFCMAFGWKQAGKSHPHVDAIGPDGTRYQIKGRRVTRKNKSRQLGALRDLCGEHFDFLAGVLFSEDYSIMRAAPIIKLELFHNTAPSLKELSIGFELLSGVTLDQATKRNCW